MYGNLQYDYIFHDQPKEFIDELNAIDMSALHNSTYTQYVVSSCVGCFLDFSK